LWHPAHRASNSSLGVCANTAVARSANRTITVVTSHISAVNAHNARDVSSVTETGEHVACSTLLSNIRGYNL
jgi:hypothetical protein